MGSTQATRGACTSAQEQRTLPLAPHSPRAQHMVQQKPQALQGFVTLPLLCQFCSSQASHCACQCFKDMPQKLPNIPSCHTPQSPPRRGEIGVSRA